MKLDWSMLSITEFYPLVALKFCTALRNFSKFLVIPENLCTVHVLVQKSRIP